LFDSGDDLCIDSPVACLSILSTLSGIDNKIRNARENKKDGVTLRHPFSIFAHSFGSTLLFLSLFLLALFSFLVLLLFQFQPLLLALFPLLFDFLLQFQLILLTLFSFLFLLLLHFQAILLALFAFLLLLGV